MSRVGRNDPCPCGSGRKYKHCCLRGETAAKSEVISRDRAWNKLMDELLDFAREERFRADLVSAFDLFWNKSYTLEEINSLPPVQVMSFLDWYAHDYATSEDGLRIVEIFLTERGPTLSEQEVGLLEADRDSLFSAYEVTDLEEWKTVKVLDVFQDLEYEFRYSPALEGMTAGQLLLGRLVARDGFHRFSWITTLVPPEIEDDLKSHIQEMFARYQEDHYQAPWTEFLRERSYLFNHFMLRVRGRLPSPKILLPRREDEDAKARPLVLTPHVQETQERPSVLLPGKGDGEPAPTVLIPGADD